MVAGCIYGFLGGVIIHSLASPPKRSGLILELGLGLLLDFFFGVDMVTPFARYSSSNNTIVCPVVPRFISRTL